jgi:leucyl/phenylalanyl-tRNA---protein transferase
VSRRFGPSELLDCYRRGVFPMSDARDDPRLFLVDPDLRGVIPLEGFHVPRRLARTVRADPFRVSVNEAFPAVIEACAEPGEGRNGTWINSHIVNLYTALHRGGYAHSVECWEGDRLVGGLYGVSLGAAFFGESMFSRARDASKIALVHLVARLKRGRYELLDAQFTSAHLVQFGIEELSRDDFQARLRRALVREGTFGDTEDGFTGQEALQEITQTS